MQKQIRVIRTYHVTVEAVYGDTPETLVQKGMDAVNDTTPYDETAVLMPDEPVETETPAEDVTETSEETN